MGHLPDFPPRFFTPAEVQHQGIAITELSQYEVSLYYQMQGKAVPTKHIEVWDWKKIKDEIPAEKQAKMTHVWYKVRPTMKLERKERQP